MRTYNIAKVENVEALIAKFEECSTWCLCQGFEVETEVGSTVFLNIAFSENGAQEYAAYRRLDDRMAVQVESLTMSWMTAQERAETFREISSARLIDLEPVIAFMQSKPIALSENHDSDTCPYCQ